MMSETIEIKKSVEVEAEASIEIQVDYVECNGCGKHVEFALTCDNRGDLQIYIEPHNCDE